MYKRQALLRTVIYQVVVFTILSGGFLFLVCPPNVLPLYKPAKRLVSSYVRFRNRYGAVTTYLYVFCSFSYMFLCLFLLFDNCINVKWYTNILSSEEGTSVPKHVNFIVKTLFQKSADGELQYIWLNIKYLHIYTNVKFFKFLPYFSKCYDTDR